MGISASQHIICSLSHTPARLAFFLLIPSPLHSLQIKQPAQWVCMVWIKTIEEKGWGESHGPVIIQKALQWKQYCPWLFNDRSPTVQGLASVMHSKINVHHEKDSSPKKWKFCHKLLSSRSKPVKNPPSEHKISSFKCFVHKNESHWPHVHCIDKNRHLKFERCENKTVWWQNFPFWENYPFIVKTSKILTWHFFYLVFIIYLFVFFLLMQASFLICNIPLK